MNYNSRKFLLCLLVIILASVYLPLGFITAQIWAATVGSTLGLYCAANVVQKATTPSSEEK